MKYQAFSILLLAISTLLSACEGDGVVSSVTIDMIPLEQTLGGEAHELSGSGSISVTPFDINTNTLYTSVNFDIATRSGEIPPLPLGTWN